MIRMQARDVEHFTCDNLDSLCPQVGYADEKRVKENIFLWSVHSPPSQSALRGF